MIKSFKFISVGDKKRFTQNSEQPQLVKKMKRLILGLLNSIRGVLHFTINKYGIVSLIVCVFLLHVIYFFKCSAPFTFNSDTVGYFQAFQPWNGQISPTRPLVYCCFLSFCRLFGEEEFLYPVVIIQICVFIGVLLLFSNMLKKKGCHAWIIFIGAILLCLFSVRYNFSVYPESFSISGVMLLLYLFDSYSNHPSGMSLCQVILFVAFLILLKPVFLVAGIALLLMLIIRWLLFKDDWKILKKGCGGLFFAAMILLLYCEENYRCNHYWGISAIGIQQDLLDIYQSEAFRHCSPSPIRSYFESSFQTGEDMYYPVILVQRWGSKRIDLQTEFYDACPRILFTNENVKMVYQWLKDADMQGKESPPVSLKDLKIFIREGKLTSQYLKKQIGKIVLGVHTMWLPFLIVFFSFVYALLGVRLIQCSSLLIFANLLYAGFAATVILRSPMDQPSRLMFPITPILILNLCVIGSLAINQLLDGMQKENNLLKNLLLSLR